MQKAGEEEGGEKKPVLKKRKRRTGLSCDQRCESCKNPCDNPLKPDVVKKKHL